MKKKSILYFCLITLIIISPLSVCAKELKEEIFTYGGNGNDYFYDVTESQDGGYVAVGYTYSTDVEGITNNGMNDAIIVKYDKNDNIVWQKNYGGNYADYFYGVTTSTDGGYVAVGYTHSTDIEGITKKGNCDTIMVKYDKEGNVEWQKTYGGNGEDWFYGVTASTDGGYVVVGSTYSTDIEGITNKGYNDAIIVKYDRNGTIEWQKNYGGTFDDFFVRVTLTTDGGYVVVGYTDSTDIEGITNHGEVDGIIVKYDKNGNIEWQKGYGGSNDDFFYEVTTSTDGGYVVVGFTESTDIEGITNHGEVDGIIVKYDKEGNVEWQNNYGGSSDDLYAGVTTIDGGYITVGISSSTDIEGITNHGEVDGIIVKYDKNGNIEWQKDYGGSHLEEFIRVATTSDGRYVVVGDTNSTDIDGFTNKGSSDALIITLSYEYDLEKEETSNGNFEVIQEGNMGKITINPDTGYELDEIIITDSSGKRIDYYEKDGDYYFDLTDDVTVSVKYKEIVNPSTGLSTPYIVFSSFILISIIISLVLKKKRYI